MAKFFDRIQPQHQTFIEEQKMFFVATAPLSPDGHVNRFVLPMATRQIIVANIHRVQTSCGFSVPLYEYTGERDHAQKWAARKGIEGLETYKVEKNYTSIDGLPTMLAKQSNH